MKWIRLCLTRHSSLPSLRDTAVSFGSVVPVASVVTPSAAAQIQDSTNVNVAPSEEKTNASETTEPKKKGRFTVVESSGGGSSSNLARAPSMANLTDASKRGGGSSAASSQDLTGVLGRPPAAPPPGAASVSSAMLPRLNELLEQASQQQQVGKGERTVH